jgi:hypothetical protein
LRAYPVTTPPQKLITGTAGSINASGFSSTPNYGLTLSWEAVFSSKKLPMCYLLRYKDCGFIYNYLILQARLPRLELGTYGLEVTPRSPYELAMSKDK